MNNARRLHKVDADGYTQHEETIEDYHERLREEEKAVRIKLKGKLIWNSAEQGTYVTPKDETPEIKE